MSKKAFKQSMLVTLDTGEQKNVCCGPAVVALGSAVTAYVPTPDKVQCMNRDNIAGCPVKAMRAEARKKTEKKISELRAKAAILREEADRLERRIK